MQAEKHTAAASAGPAAYPKEACRLFASAGLQNDCAGHCKTLLFHGRRPQPRLCVLLIRPKLPGTGLVRMLSTRFLNVSVPWYRQNYCLHGCGPADHQVCGQSRRAPGQADGGYLFAFQLNGALPRPLGSDIRAFHLGQTGFCKFVYLRRIRGGRLFICSGSGYGSLLSTKQPVSPALTTVSVRAQLGRKQNVRPVKIHVGKPAERRQVINPAFAYRGNKTDGPRHRNAPEGPKAVPCVMGLLRAKIKVRHPILSFLHCRRSSVVILPNPRRGWLGF